MSSPVDSPPHPFWGSDMPEETNELEGIGSGASSQPGSGRPREKKRVGFYSESESEEHTPRITRVGPSDEVETSPNPSPGHISPRNFDSNAQRHSRAVSDDLPLPRNISRSHLPELSPQQTQEIHDAFSGSLPDIHISRPRPAIRRVQSSQAALPDEEIEGPDELGQRQHRQTRMREAWERGKRLEEDQRSQPNSRQNSPERRHTRWFHPADDVNDMPLEDLDEDENEDDSDDEDMPALKRTRAITHREAERLVKRHTAAQRAFENEKTASGYRSGYATPTEDQAYIQDYRPHPEQYRGGILAQLLRLYNQHDDAPDQRRSSHAGGYFRRRQHSDDVSLTPTPQHSPPDSGTVTPIGGSPRKHWYSRKDRSSPSKSPSTASLAQLVGTSASLGTPLTTNLGEQVSQRLKERKEQEKRPGLGKRIHSSASALNRAARGQRLEDEIKITVHIAETIARQRYLMRLCRGLMIYGAPTHRLEEYMRMSARVLEIEAQFLYIPGSMIMSFDDTSTHTTEVKLIKAAQGIDLGRLRDVHEVYKEVVHDRMGVEEATQRLKEVMARNPKHSRVLRIPVYGLAAVCVGPFAFQARFIDLPIIFFLGCILGVLQLIIAPASDLYANVFEISAAIITSFLSRAFGSIPHGDGDRLFCFSALAQSSIALILPGYIVLCAALELQSRSIVAGSVRMVYAIIYSLFLGYGITIGTVIYGVMDSNATSQTQCPNPIHSHWYFLFVPGFALCLTIINQAKWKQSPIMVFIALVGYVVNFYSSKRFAGNTQISNSLGALAIGVLANLYSRIGSKIENWFLDRWEDDLRPKWRKFRKSMFGIHDKIKSPKKLEDGTASDTESVYSRQTRRVGYSLAAAAMLPAIFVQVPSGLAVNGSLVSGLNSANQIVGDGSNGTQVTNSTAISSGDSALNSIAFNVSYSVVQVAIGITVGLFLSAIVVYPLGKRRSGLFSF